MGGDRHGMFRMNNFPWIHFFVYRLVVSDKYVYASFLLLRDIFESKLVLDLGAIGGSSVE